MTPPQPLDLRTQEWLFRSGKVYVPVGVIHRRSGRETWRETSCPDKLDMQDAAPLCVNTWGPLTPPAPVRTSELR